MQLGCGVALVLGRAPRSLCRSLTFMTPSQMLTLSEAMAAWIEGIKEVLEPTIVLLLAWALGSVIADVGTATYLAKSLQVCLVSPSTDIGRPDRSCFFSWPA